MKTAKRALAILLAAILMASCFCFTSFAAVKTPKSMSIVTLPTKKYYYKDTDWGYGYWDFPESGTPSFKAKNNLISLKYNGGMHHKYEDRGMIDLRGLVVKVTYTDGSSENLSYYETVRNTTVIPNIYASPSKEYFIGENTIEIYFDSAPSVYTTFKINILGYKLGDVNNDGSINSSDALLILSDVVDIKKLNSNQKIYADLNGDSKYSSADALAILRISVGIK